MRGAACATLSIRQSPDNLRQQTTRPEQLHLNGRNGFLLEPGNLRHRTLLDVKQIERCPFGCVELSQTKTKQGDATLHVEHFFEARAFCKLSFMNLIEILRRTPSPPVIPDRIAYDLAEKRLGESDFVLFSKGFDGFERSVLLEIFIVQGPARPLCRNANQHADFNRINVHSDQSPQAAAIRNMIGKSEVMQQLAERVKVAARITGSVLVTGETGSGKELVAHAIHEHSGRSSGRFVAIDCGALPEDLIESELFGFKRGAFTSAQTDKSGLFEEANGGTLFLDEISNTSRRFQAKLLRALQERQIRRLGDTAYRKVDIRVIAATNRDLRTLVSRGDFREDLFYRLSVFAIQVPPLRNRLDDIPLLVEAMLNGRKQITGEALSKLQLYNFPGNVRELENIIESAVYTAANDAIEECHIVLPDGVTPGTTDILHVENFWDSVARPYADRLITRTHVENVVRRGLEQSRGSYRQLVRLFNLPDSDYKRFMDFLRRHRCNVDYRQYRQKPE